jgi:serine/threonine-protein kinase
MSSAPSVPVTTAAPAPPPGVETADLAPASGVEATDLAPPSPDAGDYARIKALFNAVCDLPDIAAQHAALAAQGADAATAERVLALLGHGAAQTRFAAPVAAAAARWLDQELAPGDRLGAWTLEHEMGRGGMGRVFAARRSDGHYEQRAAIKVLLGYTGSEAQQRLMRERQILASLEHPNIARLLDGGTTPAGRPYLVMEFAEGQPIDRHAEAQRLDLDARLQLADAVCEALAYAHRNLVIHCDIKPGNVLVDADGRVRLIDFGISRLEGEADGEAGAPAMTPGYASPEQQAGRAPGVASDIYSLGRLLQELLAPLRGRHRRGHELDAVVAKATAPDPALRYHSVAALQIDLQRLRAHLPVEALPQTVAYVTGKLLQRRWPWALAATAALLMAAGFTVRVVQERNEAQFQRQQAEGLIEFMLGDLRRKLEPVGRLDALDAVGQRALAHYGESPDAALDGAALGRRARALHLIGEIARLRGQAETATTAFARAAATTARQLALAPDDPQRIFDHAQSVFWVGALDYDAGRYEAAEAAFQRYEALARDLVAREPARIEWRIETAYAARNLAMLELKRMRLAAATQGFERARDAWQALVAVRPDLSLELAEDTLSIAQVSDLSGRYGEAIQHYDTAAALVAALAERDGNNRALAPLQYALRRAAWSAMARGDAVLADDYVRRAVAAGLRLLEIDPSNQDVRSELGFSYHMLSHLEATRGRVASARSALGRVRAELAVLLGVKGKELPLTRTLQAMTLAQAAALAPAGSADAKRAAAELRDLLSDDRSAGAGPHEAEPDRNLALALARAHFELGRLLSAQGQPGDARAHWDAALALLPEAPVPAWDAVTLRARVLLAAGRVEPARALAARLAASAYRHPDVADLQRALAGGAGQHQGVAR